VKERFLYGGSPVLEADFKAAPTDGLAPLAVDFSNRSIGLYSEMVWDFGDGVTSTITNPVHIYTSGGTYTPTLTLSSPGGDAQHQDVIQVTGNVYRIFLPLVQYLEELVRAYLPVILR
jgi:PKD repeat protein